MTCVLTGIVCFVLGALFGTGVLALCTASKYDYDKSKEENKNETD